MSAVQDLQTLVLDRLNELGDRRGPLSARQAALRSDGKVSYETLRLIARGDHSGRLEDDTVAGLALALDVPRSKVLAAMGRSMTQPLAPFMLPDRADLLTRQQRKLVLQLIDALLDASQPQQEAPAEDARSPRSVASGQRGDCAQAQQEVSSKAARARQEVESE